ncbi:sterile alpha motif domain-containing protein 13 isoform X1 [Cervus elaphus]|uniref:sterile alpha motif domain-containing protein 13 isoform X1 n=1 Tax=Cervus elaphus TaxID=9860 RepID=UPI001CC2C93C|nr:sterile alpha motif domain-containing protein 13 isoform X1 [Cervus elaphus]
MLSSVRNCQTIFLTSAILHSHQRCVSTPVLCPQEFGVISLLHSISSMENGRPPDPADWAVMDVVNYFRMAGFEEQASAFQEQRKTQALRQRHGRSCREEGQVSSTSASSERWPSPAFNTITRGSRTQEKRKSRGESGGETRSCLLLASAPPELLLKPPPMCLLGAEQS